MKKTALIALLFVLGGLLLGVAHGQQIDLGFGISTTTSSGPTTSNGLLFPSLRGGVYPGFSGDLLLRHNFGFEGDLFWRASQTLYGGYQPYRPIFYSFNAIYAPKITKNISAEVLGGIGGEDLRFYGFINCSSFFGCTTYSSSNHFLGDVGGGIRAYFWHGAFLRPEARVYFVHNNVEFSSGTVARYGVSLGYTFGAH